MSAVDVPRGTPEGTVRWFGSSWGAAVNDPDAQIQVPFGAECGGCTRPLQHGDRGVSIPFGYASQEAMHFLPPRVAFHLVCWVENVCGALVAARVVADLDAKGDQG